MPWSCCCFTRRQSDGEAEETPPQGSASALERQASSERRSSASHTLSLSKNGLEHDSKRSSVSMKHQGSDWKPRQMATSESVEIDDLTTIDSITRKHIEIIEPVSRTLSSSRRTRSSQGEMKRVSFVESNVSDPTLNTYTGSTHLLEFEPVVSTTEERQRSSSSVSRSTFSKSNKRVSRSLSPMPSKHSTSKKKTIWYPAAKPPSPTSLQQRTQEVKYQGIALGYDRVHELEPILPSDRDTTPVCAGAWSDNQLANLSILPSNTAGMKGTTSPKNRPSFSMGRPSPPNRDQRRSPTLQDTSGIEYPYEAPLLKTGSRITTDRLSVLHGTNSDSKLRERYNMACKLLKSALIERDSVLQPAEKVFLEELLREDEESVVSNAQLSAVQSATNTLLSDPIFRVGSVDTEAFEEAQDTLNKTGETGLTEMVEGEYRKQEKKIESSFASFDGRNYPFLILGADVKEPMVLTPALMESLRGFFPSVVSKQNFWLKFQMIRDGKTLLSLLSRIRTSKHTLLCVESKDGNVFGAFCSAPWRLQRSWYGSRGCFFWRLKISTGDPNAQTKNYANDNLVEIFPFTDDMIQFCSTTTLAVAGGNWDDSKTKPYDEKQTGIRLTIDGDLMGGETNGCATFASQRLHATNVNEFEIEHLEVWTLTPCKTVSEAERTEIQQLFVEESKVAKEATCATSMGKY